MKAWQAGIVVVAAAGNRGPDAMSIGVPGNVPYVVTVGDFSDQGTPDNLTDDVLASFSSTGPTVEGFVKPEVIAPGMALLGLMPQDSQMAQDHSDWYTGNDRYYTMSGTSQAAAVVSGIAALLLQKDPTLTPDDVKCRLMDGARPAVDEKDELVYAIFQQGAGLVNAYDALSSTTCNCANQGLNVDYDLNGTAHYGGSANQGNDGSYYVMDLDSYAWSGGYAWGDGYAWGSAYAWGNGYAWSASLNGWVSKE